MSVIHATRPGTDAAQPERRSRWRRLWAWTTTALLILVSTLALLTVAIPFALGADTYTVLTGSMRPALEPGSLVAVRETPVDEIRVGDIVTYQLEPGEPAVVTHRVVGISRTSGGEVELITRGDANDGDDPPVLPVQVRGVVVYAVPWLGYPNVLVSGQARSVLVLALGALVVLYGFVILGIDIVRAHRRRRAAVWSIAAIVAAGLCVAAPAPPASADVSEPAGTDVLFLSTDGRTWTTGTPAALFDGARTVAPGESIADTLWVRNASEDRATPGLEFTFVPADDGSAADRALAADAYVAAEGDVVRSGDHWQGGPIPPGGERRIDLALGLEAGSTNSTRNAAVRVDAVVHLSEYIPPGGTDAGTGGVVGLPVTGAVIPVALLVLGGGLALVGTAIRVSSRRQGRAH